MLALPIHTLQPQRGTRFELERLPHLREIIRQCADKLPLTPLEVAAILDDAYDNDVERIELVRTCGKEMDISDAKYRLDTNIISKEEFLEMTPIAGTTSVFYPMSDKSTIHYTLGVTADVDSVSMLIERKSDDMVSINMQSSPTSQWVYIDNLHVDQDTSRLLFEAISSLNGSANIASSWPCTRGLRVDYKGEMLNMVLPPSLVSTLLDALMVSSGVDALLEVHRTQELPARPWIADGDVTIKVEPPSVGVYNAISLKIPLHPLSVHVPNGRMELFLSVCGCATQEHPSCLLCGRCKSWVGDDERRAAFAGHCHRAGDRCLNRIRLTVGKSTGGAWVDKRSLQLCVRDEPRAMALVEAVADVIEFANKAKELRFKCSELVQHVSNLPSPVHVINDLPEVRCVTKLLKKNTYSVQYDKKKKLSILTDKNGSKLSKGITKRYSWLFPRAN